ncbi:MAG TPA: NAD-dependent epimerase/dehydratase family protein [Candidatus Eisenbacteria bacterium]|jgi:nucleoside-diphosphate-sugar epimerase
MKTYLVTGGAGFIGSHVVDALLARGNRVRVVDNFSTGKRSNLPEGAELFEEDITDLESIRPAFEGVAGVFHLAALPRVQVSIERPLETHHANITGTLNVLLAARDAGVRRLVYSASSSAYGDTDVLPEPETLLPRPLSPYGLQKYVGEHYARLFAELYGMETVSLRYFNVYGPRMAEEGAYVTVISIFLRERAAGRPLPITGDGTQTRDFTHVRDVVRANLLAMESSRVGKGEVLNIGNGENRSVNDVARSIGGPTVNLEPRIEPHDTRADNRRARELLGWRPEVDYAEAICELKRAHGIP